MKAKFGKWWRLCKALFALAILVAIGGRFARDLQSPELWNRSFHPGWLAASGILYLAGLGCSAFFWYRFLHELGQYPSFPAALRAYYIGQMGKYLPGKAWALMVRSTMVAGPRVRLSVAVYSSLYEVLTTMATGVLLAAILFLVLLPGSDSIANWAVLRRIFTRDRAEILTPDRDSLLVLTLLLLVGVGLPLIPALFNRLVHRLSSLKKVFGATGSTTALPLPHVRIISLVEGFFITSGCWLLFGASVWAILRGVLGEAIPWEWDALGRYTAFMGLAYVAGFVILLVPSGIGIREFLLTLFLVPEISRLLEMSNSAARPLALLAVLVLRLVWTASEVVIVSILWWCPGPEKAPALEQTTPEVEGTNP